LLARITLARATLMNHPTAIKCYDMYMNVISSRANVLFARARNIYKHEGLIPLLQRGSTFLAKRCFRYRTFNLIECAIENIDNLSEADFMPKIDEFTSKIISTKEEADELEADGLDVRLWPLNYREMLDKGAVVSCVLVGGELASIYWACMTDEARESLGEPPCKVDFSKGEAYAGGFITSPKYRGIGLATYVDFKTFQFLKEKGKIVTRHIAATENVAPHRIAAKFGAKVYGKGRYLRVLWWQSWKEKLLDEAAE
jgi:hypothetical protein